MTEATGKEVTYMGGVMAVKKYLEKDSEAGNLTAKEMQTFWKSCSEEEKESFARIAAKRLGVELKH